MPELPEIERQRISLSAWVGDRVSAVNLVRSDRRMGITPRVFQNLRDQAIDGVDRRGKFLILRFSDQTSLIVHCGMSGRFIVRPPGAIHDLFALKLETGVWIVYSDFRRFGRVWRLPAQEVTTIGPLADLGPEPLSRQFTPATMPPRSRRSVKQVLLDQHVVAGLGNIYVCESLYHAGIHPHRAINSLSSADRTLLVRAIKATLRRAIRRGGSTLNDYRGTEGQAGDFDRFFSVFAKSGQPCPRCTCEQGISRITQQGRSTFFCATFQR